MFSLLKCRILLGFSLLAAVTSAAWTLPAPEKTEDPISQTSTEDLLEDMQVVPCQNNRRLEAVRSLFEKAGAPSDDISLQEFKGVTNLTVLLPGKTAETIVVGAHYDKSPAGCGAIDNWSGIVLLAHIYQTLQQFSHLKTVQFVAFGREEDGLIGSKKMVRSLAEESLPNICAMINLDSFGMGLAQGADNLSSRSLIDLASRLTEGSEFPFRHGHVPGDSDSSSFLKHKVPAITLHGLGDGFQKILHGSRDQLDQVRMDSLLLGYRLTLELIQEIDQQACDFWRSNEGWKRKR